MLKKIDWYIIKKFLGTFFYAIILIISIVIVFDISEKLQDFIEKQAPIKAIVFDYYLNFVPYFVNLFSPLFVFISVIFFTSKLASKSEIVAILSGGISFNRFLRPYLISATVLAALAFYLNNFLIPKTNIKRLAFEEQYIRNKFRNTDHNIHAQLSKDTYIYMTGYNVDLNMGHNFSMEKIKEGKLSYKLISDNIIWDTITSKWRINNFVERTFDGLEETIIKGNSKDTTIQELTTAEFKRRDNYVETMNYFQLNDFIDLQVFKGSQNIIRYQIEKQKRMALPFATFVLTIIGVSLSSRKVRGGIGMHIGLGILISFSYILFMQISTTLATNSGWSAMWAVWLPNIIYSVLAVYLLVKAPK